MQVLWDYSTVNSCSLIIRLYVGLKQSISTQVDINMVPRRKIVESTEKAKTQQAIIIEI